MTEAGGGAYVTSSDGTPIGYQLTGAGPPVILVDPAGAFRGVQPMPELAPALARHLTVYAYDRRGRGESGDGTPYAVEREIEDLAALLDAAGGAAGVYGFSSGAVLAARAAAAGLPVRRLALLEPAVDLDGPPDPDLKAEVAELVAAGRRGDALIHFNTSIGVPPEMVAGLREHPAWPQLEALAHTLVYDLTFLGTTTAAQLAGVDVPTLVVASEGSDDGLRAMARRAAEVVPGGEFRTLPGGWHGPDVDALADVVVAHLTA